MQYRSSECFFVSKVLLVLATEFIVVYCVQLVAVSICYRGRSMTCVYACVVA